MRMIVSRSFYLNAHAKAQRTNALAQAVLLGAFAPLRELLTPA
jgi:hypothetical protein